MVETYEYRAYGSLTHYPGPVQPATIIKYKGMEN